MRIRYSKRGLTFSFQANETFRPGTLYRYIVDMKNSAVLIIPDENGKYKMSKKGAAQRPLVDLRNREVAAALANAQYMEVEVLNDRIIVHVIQTSALPATDNDIVELVSESEGTTFVFDKADFAKHNSDINDALAAGGLFSAKVNEDISYVFDVVSLFSGAGMLDLPFKQDESFNIKFAVDFDESACETYRHMIGDHIHRLDMRDLNPDDVPPCDVIIGGPCCQGYSNANRAVTGKESARQKRLLIHDYIRIVKEKHPLVFLIENVMQFLTKDSGAHLNAIISELPEYVITYAIVNDNDVGGYSIRKRMLLIGSRIGRIEIPDVELFSRKTCGDALRKVNAEWSHYHDLTVSGEDTQRKMRFVKDGQNYKAIPEMSHLDRHSNTYRRLSSDKPAVTILNWRKISMMPPEEFLDTDANGDKVQRQLNCAEAKALQGLGKDFMFFGSLNDIQQQIGNGVTRAIASFAKSLVKNALLAYANRMCEPVTG